MDKNSAIVLPPTNFNALPYGSLPPRLVILKSGFLKNPYSYDVPLAHGVEYRYENGNLIFYHTSKGCYVEPAPTLKKPYFVNNDPLAETHLLSNGDLIHRGRYERIIFVADPVEVYSHEFADMSPEDKEHFFEYDDAEITERLRRVIITPTQISLDAGKNFVDWNAITYISCQVRWFRKHNIRIVTSESVDPAMPYTEICDLSGWEAESLRDWLEVASPIYLSVRKNSIFCPCYELHAYGYTISQLILDPAFKNNTKPILSEDQLFPSTYHEPIFYVLFAYVFMVLYFIALFLDEVNGQPTFSQTLFLIKMVVFYFPLAILITSLLFIPMFWVLLQVLKYVNNWLANKFPPKNVQL